jgi:hypothetical protein
MNEPGSERLSEKREPSRELRENTARREPHPPEIDLLG